VGCLQAAEEEAAAAELGFVVRHCADAVIGVAGNDDCGHAYCYQSITYNTDYTPNSSHNHNNHQPRRAL